MRYAYASRAALVAADGAELQVRVHDACSPVDRFLGLMGREGELIAGEPPRCVLFGRCTSLHTFWMRAQIDVLWLDRSLSATGAAERVDPGRVLFAPPGTWGALELPAGTLARLKRRGGASRVVM